MTRRRRPSPATTKVLLALAERPVEWSYGYDLCSRLGLKAGTMYPILMRLAERGQIETRWEDDPPRGRPARHLYRLTVDGAAWATELTSAPQGSPSTVWSARPATGTVG